MATNMPDMVRYRLGEAGFGAQSSLFNAQHVGFELDEAIKWVVSRAPLHSLASLVVQYNAESYPTGSRLKLEAPDATVFYVQAPDNMLRFVEIQAASWTNPARELLSESQKSAYHSGATALDATQEPTALYPRCVLTWYRFDGDLVVRRAFALQPGETVATGVVPRWAVNMDHFWYIPDVSNAGGGTRVDLPDIIRDAAVWDACSRIVQSDEDMAHRASLFAQRRDDVLRGIASKIKPVTHRRPVYL